MMRINRRTAHVVASLALAWGAQVRAQTIYYYVDDDTENKYPCGYSWEEACMYLQDALAQAGAGDEIHVAGGTYKPDRGDEIAWLDRTATFLLGGRTVLGGYAGFADPAAEGGELSALN